MPTHPPAKKDLKHFAYIDALRGMAILLVVFHHLPHAWHKVRDYFLEVFSTESAGQLAFDIYDVVVNYSAHGVQLFYVLSAFTLLNSLYKRNEKKPFIKFFIRRLFRIAPMFYFYIGVVLLVYFFLQIQLYQGDALSSDTIVSLVTFTNGFDPQILNFIKGGWSIAVEMNFYLLMPLLYLLIRNMKSALLGTSAALIGILFLLNYLFVQGGADQSELWSTFIFTFFPSQLPVFLLGIILYFLIHQKKKMHQIIAYVVYLLLTVAYLLVQIYFPEAWFANLEVFKQKVFLMGLLFVHLIFVLAYAPFRLLVNWLSIFIGRLSFSIYLWHLGVIDMMNEYGVIAWIEAKDWNPLAALGVRFLLILGVTVILSFLTFHLIEKRGIALGRALIKRMD